MLSLEFSWILEFYFQPKSSARCWDISPGDTKDQNFFRRSYSDQCPGETWQKDWRTRAKLSSDCDFDLGQETSRKSVQELLPILSWSKLILEFAKCSDLSLAPGTWAGGHAWPCLAMPPYSQHPGRGFLLIWPGPIFVVCWRRADTCLGRTWWVICLFFDMSRCRIRPLLAFYHKIILWDNRRWDVSVFFSFERAPCVTAGIWKCQYRHQTYLLRDWCSCRHGRELFIHTGVPGALILDAEACCWSLEWSSWRRAQGEVSPDVTWLIAESEHLNCAESRLLGKNVPQWSPKLASAPA